MLLNGLMEWHFLPFLMKLETIVPSAVSRIETVTKTTISNDSLEVAALAIIFKN